MNELQLYISKSAREFRTLVDINGEDDIRSRLRDMRPTVESVDYPSDAKVLFYAVDYINDGYLIHVLRTIPPQRGNHLDATIFVDRNIDILAEDLEEVVAKVGEKILAPSVTQADMDELNELFSREYDSRDKTPKIKASHGQATAFMCYGNNYQRSLFDIISDGLYRRQWSSYAVVLLLPDNLDVNSAEAVDLDTVEEKPSKKSKKAGDLPGDNIGQTVHNYVFALPMVTPDGRSLLEFEVDCSKPITRSPIPGYEIKGKPAEGDDKVCRLHRSGSGPVSLFTKLLWACGGIVVGLLIAGIGSLFGSSDSDDNSVKSEDIEIISESRAPEKKTERPNKKDSAAAPAAKQVTTSEATRYLDTHRVWQRDKMEKIDGLKGLYDDLNNFNFDDLINKWGPQLEASKNFGKIVKASKRAMDKKTDPRRDAEHNPSYNRDGDGQISWLGYTYWIDP